MEPAQVEGDVATGRRGGVEQAVGDGSVVGDCEVGEMEASLRLLEVSLYRVLWNGDRPEQTLAGTAVDDSGVVVV